VYRFARGATRAGDDRSTLTDSSGRPLYELHLVPTGLAGRDGKPWVSGLERFVARGVSPKEPALWRNAWRNAAGAGVLVAKIPEFT
jgi:hypothetical protein